MNNLEYYKNKKNSEVIKYLKEYKLYNEDNFKSDEIKTLICLIIKNCNLTKLEKKKTLELVLNELFENYKYDRDYEFNDYFKYNNEFILKLLLYYKNKIKISRIEFELILIKEKEDKCNSVINFNILNSYKYFSFDCDLNRYDIRCRKIVNPLFLAYYFSLSDIVDILINKYGAYVYIKDNEGNTLLHIYGGVNKIISLINNEYHINVINNKGETPLHKACIQYNYVTNCLIYKLLKYGANINAQDNEGNTPLINLSRTAANKKNVVFLIEQGADISKANNKGETPLITACKYGKKEIVKILLDYGADINKQDNEGNSPLHIACKYYKNVGKESIIEYLIKRGADINILDNENETPIFEICRYFNKYINNFFIENGAKINIKNKYGDTPLKITCLYNVSLIDFLIEKGAK